jgi:hypothetical protein
LSNYKKHKILVKLSCCLTLLFHTLLSCSQPSTSTRQQSVTSEVGRKINGVSFVASPRKINDTAIAPVVQLNANWVSLMPFAFMRNIDSPTIQYDNERQWRGERKEGVKETALAFHNKGIQVMIKPQIWIGRGAFTGHISMTTEEHWKLLEQNYEAFILDYAKVAEEVKCRLFCIGTELNIFVTKRPEFWNSLIEKIRKVYSGQLTYAENWDTYSTVPFWSKLDYIGIDAYFPLSDEREVTLKALETGWAKYKSKIEALYKSTTRKILFTEYGYRSYDYTAKEPWANNKFAVNINNQQIALEALFGAFWKEPWFAGGFVWKWYDDHDKVGGENNTDYTPQNKPSQKLITEVYQKH